MRRDTDRLEDILEAIEAIERYSKEGRSRFDADELVRTWILKHIEIIGEAVSRLSQEIVARSPSAPWRDIVAMRVMLIPVGGDSGEGGRPREDDVVKNMVFLLLLLTALAVPIFAQETGKQVTGRYDEVENYTVVALEPELECSGPSLYARGIREVAFKNPDDKDIILGFKFSSKSEELLKCNELGDMAIGEYLKRHELSAIANGELIDLGESKHEYRVVDGEAVEFVSVSINISTLVKIVSTLPVEFKLCNTKIPFTAPRRDQLVHFATIMKFNHSILTGQVTRVDGPNVYLNLGFIEGLKVGEKLAVFPDKRLQDQLGVFTVKDVLGERRSSGTFVGRTVAVGAWVSK